MQNTEVDMRINKLLTRDHRVGRLWHMLSLQNCTFEVAVLIIQFYVNKNKT